ncbi:recombination directionality factor [Streptomyces katsurahamanus]|uniref:Uncharacterized protein n=1 Tax=Streptomyces katsurahamanus TaxID=2577098 RepID=A0ABW9NLQ6_9ACTN|nr:hypothetical protein [Streptomyces katsurahamanus]MQS34187.1 hypothetical protein [Streptomyces katsurahamanus]
MTSSEPAPVGRFHSGRMVDGIPHMLGAWRVTTEDEAVAGRVAALMGGRPSLVGTAVGGGSLEVLTERESVRVLLDGTGAVRSDLVFWRGDELVHRCDGVAFLSPETRRGQPCGCPMLLEDRKAAVRSKAGPAPRIDVVFRIAADPALGEFRFRTGSWKLAERLWEVEQALDGIDGQAVCDLALESVVYTASRGREVCYRKPVLTVLGSPDSVAAEPGPDDDAMTSPSPAMAGPDGPARALRPGGRS